MLQGTKFTRRAMQVMLGIFLCAAMFVGCSSNSNPAGPGDGDTTPPSAKKPVSLTITSIEVSKFKDKSWDPSELISAWKKADLWVSLGRKGADADFSSKTINDASATSSHTFTKTGVLFGKNLPLAYSYVDNLVIDVWDNDIFSNEEISTIALSPENIYNNDEASTFKATLTGKNSTSIIVRGTWKY